MGVVQDELLILITVWVIDAISYRIRKRLI